MFQAEGRRGDGGKASPQLRRGREKGGNDSLCSALLSDGPEQRGDYLSVVPAWC